MGLFCINFPLILIFSIFITSSRAGGKINILLFLTNLIYCSLEPPRIQPFTLPEFIEVGARDLILSCAVNRGADPLEFTWLKNEIVLKSNSKYQFTNQARFSFLKIPIITREDSANYTCIAKNSYGIDSHSASLRIRCIILLYQFYWLIIYTLAPPKWINPPKDQISIKGSDLAVNCQADSIPISTIKWISLTNPQLNLNVATNGSLIFKSVSLFNQGEYKCVADNGIGKALTRIISLKVVGLLF